MSWNSRKEGASKWRECGMLLTDQVHGEHPWQVQACQGNSLASQFTKTSRWKKGKGGGGGGGKRREKERVSGEEGSSQGMRGFVCHAEEYRVYTVKI